MQKSLIQNLQSIESLQYVLLFINEPCQIFFVTLVVQIISLFPSFCLISPHGLSNKYEVMIFYLDPI